MLNTIQSIAEEAGDAILAVYNRPDAMAVSLKSDQSPVTEADMAAHRIIMEALARLSSYPVISEESAEDAAAVFESEPFWLVDPLDGTRDFLQRRDEFTVNIALIEAGQPVLGVVYAPALQEMYWAQAGHGAFFNGNPIVPSPVPQPPLRGLASYSHLDERTQQFFEHYGISEVLRMGSALKFARLARGDAAIYPRFTGSSGWDTAAGHAIANSCGCEILNAETGQPLTYSPRQLRNPFFIAKHRGVALP